MNKKGLMTGNTSRRGKEEKESKESKESKRGKKKNGKIEGLEVGQWILYTVLYASGLAIISGLITVSFPDHLIYFGSVPFDIYWFFWLVGLAVWGVITAHLFEEYKED